MEYGFSILVSPSLKTVYASDLTLGRIGLTLDKISGLDASKHHLRLLDNFVRQDFKRLK